MRVQQILLSAADGALRPHGLTFARYEALVLLTFSRHGSLPMRVMGERLQLHPTSVTNIVDRATGTADELTRKELIDGARHIAKKIRRYRPAFAAFVGITAYRTAFQRPRAILGKQEERIGETQLWVLPNPSGLNAHFQAAELGRLFKKLRGAAFVT